MNPVDQLLDRRRSPGRLINRQRFTLSRDKAFEKLREFTLRNPRQYVLELIQGAVFAGATYIAIDVDPEHAQVAWVGAPALSRDELSRLFDYLFADRGGSGQRHLVQLAVALNAMLQRKPTVLRVESGDGRQTARMDMNHRGRGQVGTAEQPITGTYVLAEFGTNWLKRFQGDSYTEEISLIEERCRYSPVPILLNGRAPFGYKASRSVRLFGVDDVEYLAAPNRWGAVGVPSPGTRAGVEIIRGGVRVVTLALPELGTVPQGAHHTRPTGLVGVIADDNLRETADHSDIVRDRHFQEMLHAVQPIATRLLQRHRPGYCPPSLPPLVDRPTDHEPLPDPIPQVPPRPALRLDQLRARPMDAPVFHVSPEDADRLRAATDPLRFPYPVLILRRGQIASLDGALPDLPAHRLGTAADVDFVRRAMQRGQQQVEITVPCPRTPGASLTLTLVLRGSRTDLGPRGGLPVLLTRHDETAAVTIVNVDLPGVGVQIDGVKSSPTVEDLRAALSQHAWRLVPRAIEQGADPDALRSLLRCLLTAHATPRLVLDDGRRLDLSLPALWGAPGRFLDLPLADTRQGPLTMRRMIALQGSDEALGLEPHEDIDQLEGIELLVGVGHLRHPTLSHPIAAVARLPGGWRWWTGRAWEDDEIQQILWVGLTHRPRLEGHPGEDTPVSMVGRWGRAPATEGELDAGLTMLYQNLLRIAMIGDWSQLCPPGVSAARVEAASRLALLQLAAHLDRLEKDPLFGRGTGQGRTSLPALSGTPGFCVVAAGGPRVPGATTLRLTLDELQACDPSDALPLRFDDPSRVWRELLDPDSAGWLLRQRVRIAGLDGWLGLRCPYDESTGVFIQTADTLVAIPELDQALPCHGLLQTSAETPHPRREELLRLARRELYQQLGSVLSGAPPGSPEHEAATLYATIYAVQSWREAGGRLRAIARELAETVQIPDEAGLPWGSLRRWLEAPEGRPTLPVRLRPLARALRSDDGDPLEMLRRRLVAASPTPLQVQIDATSAAGPLIALDTRLSDVKLRDLYFTVHLAHPAGPALLAGEPRLIELALVELARLVAGLSPEAASTLQDMQRALVGQRQV